MLALFRFDLLEQLSFYGSYHSKTGNKIVHGIFVPAILWSVCVWLAYAVVPYDLPGLLSATHLPPWLLSCATANGALILLAVFGAYYTILEPFAGLTWTAFVGCPMWLTATALEQYVPNAWAWALGVHILGWYMQIHVGHMMIEGRKPALMDSLFQSLVLANLFVWMEALFTMGYRPKLQAALEERIHKNLATLRSQQQPLLKPEPPK